MTMPADRYLRRFRLTSVEATALRLIVLLVSILIAALIAAGYGYAEFSAQQVSNENRLARLREYTELAAVSINALDYDSVDRSSLFLMDDPKILSMSVIDQFGYQVVGDREATLAQTGTGAVIQSYSLSVPARDGSGKRHVGEALFALQQTDAHSVIIQSLLRGALAFVLTLAALAISLYTYITRYVTRPALDVVDAIIDTTKTGTPAPAKVLEGSQIGQLAQHFNTMQEMLLTAQTEQRQLADELQQSVSSLSREQDRSRLQLKALNEVLQSSGQSMIYFDADGQAIFANTDRLQSDLMRQAMALAAHDPAQLGSFLAAAGATLSSAPNPADGWVVDAEVTAADGRIWSLMAIELDRGAVGVICADISDRRAVENQVLQGQKMESLGVLASGVAHEFNNILAIVQGNLEMMSLQGDIPPKSAAFLASAQRNVERASNITHSLLTFSRRRDAARSVFSAANSLRELAPMLRGSLPSAVRLHIDIASRLSLFADKVLFETAVINLVNNARDAMSGTGDIWVRLRDVNEDLEIDSLCDDNRPCVILDVEDSGPGIDPATEKSIFDPFFTTKLGSGGTGLGLSLVYSFVQSCGGTVTYSRTDRQTSRFRLRLPAGEPAKADDADGPPVDDRAKRTGIEVLVVEDEPDLLALIESALTQRGFTVHAVRSVKETEDLLHRFGDNPPFRVLLTDYSLPDGTALDVLTALHGRGIDLPALLLSGNMDIPTSEIHKFRRRLQKPVRFDDLVRAIDEAAET